MIVSTIAVAVHPDRELKVRETSYDPGAVYTNGLSNSPDVELFRNSKRQNLNQNVEILVGC